MGLFTSPCHTLAQLNTYVAKISRQCEYAGSVPGAYTLTGGDGDSIWPVFLHLQLYAVVAIVEATSQYQDLHKTTDSIYKYQSFLNLGTDDGHAYSM